MHSLGKRAAAQASREFESPPLRIPAAVGLLILCNILTNGRASRHTISLHRGTIVAHFSSGDPLMRLSRFAPFVGFAVAALVAACSGGSSAVPPSASNANGALTTGQRTVLSAKTATPSPAPSATPISTPTPMSTPTPASCGSDRDDCHRFEFVVRLRASVDTSGTLALTPVGKDRHRHWGRNDDDNACRRLDLDDAPVFSVASVDEVTVPSYAGRIPCRRRWHEEMASAALRPMRAVTPGPTATPSPTPIPTPQGQVTKYYVVMATGTEKHPTVVALIGPAVKDHDRDWLTYTPSVRSIVLQAGVKYHFFIARNTDRDDFGH